MTAQMRVSEWMSLAAFGWLIALGWARQGLGGARRGKIVVYGAIGVAAILVPALLLPRMLAPLAASVVRDWAPYILLFVFYSQAGLFVTRSDAWLEAKLLEIDQRLVAPPVACFAHRTTGRWILAYLELAYMAYYVALPGAMAALYLAGRRAAVDRFWAVALLGEYLSCATLPYVQTRPPRALAEKWSECLPASRLRAFNWWILRRGSIQANTFPSAHVALATSCALILLKLAPVWVGVVFLWTAISIAGGAVAGRYHYGADAVLGFLTGGLAYLVGAALAT